MTWRSLAIGDVAELVLLDTRLVGRDRQAGDDERPAARRPGPLAARRRAAGVAGRPPRRRDPPVVDRGQRRGGQRAGARLAPAAALDGPAGAERVRHPRRSRHARRPVGRLSRRARLADRPHARAGRCRRAHGPAVRRRPLVVGVRRADRPGDRSTRWRSSSRRRPCRRRRWAGPATRGCGGCSTGRPIAWTTSCGATSPTGATPSSRSRRRRSAATGGSSTPTTTTRRGKPSWPPASPPRWTSGRPAWRRGPAPGADPVAAGTPGGPPGPSDRPASHPSPAAAPHRGQGGGRRRHRHRCHRRHRRPRPRRPSGTVRR